MHAASFILVVFIHALSVISPAFAGRSAEETYRLAQLQAQGPAKTIETINLAMPSFNVTGLPYYVAVDKGYYLAEGIDLRIVKVQGAHTVATLLTGDIQFAVIGTTAITARYSGAPLRVIASTLARPFPVALCSARDRAAGPAQGHDRFDNSIRRCFHIFPDQSVEGKFSLERSRTGIALAINADSIYDFAQSLGKRCQPERRREATSGSERHAHDLGCRQVYPSGLWRHRGH